MLTERRGVVPPTRRPTNLEDSRVPRSLLDSLLPFQREGVSFALKRKGRVLIADDMGLGKTLQGLSPN